MRGRESWVTKRVEGGGREATFFVLKTKSSIIYFCLFMIITVYYHGVPKFMGMFQNITRTVQIFYNECAIWLQEVGTFAPKMCTPVCRTELKKKVLKMHNMEIHLFTHLSLSSYSCDSSKCIKFFMYYFIIMIYVID